MEFVEYNKYYSTTIFFFSKGKTVGEKPLPPDVLKLSSGVEKLYVNS